MIHLQDPRQPGMAHSGTFVFTATWRAYRDLNISIENEGMALDVSEVRRYYAFSHHGSQSTPTLGVNHLSFQNNQCPIVGTIHKSILCHYVEIKITPSA